MHATTYLVFGDLHGRILPAFRLASVWAREHDEAVTGLLQVGDLGYFPDASRLDKATRRHAERDPLELGAQLIAAPSKEADRVFADEHIPGGLWFTAGNHEDYDALHHWEQSAGPRASAFSVDVYSRVLCVRDGAVETLPGGLRVGALWGVDDRAPNARRHLPERARIRPRSATALSGSAFDVLLTHESPRDAMIAGAGSEDIDALLDLARPAFAFFGHYGSQGRQLSERPGPTQLFHMGGMEMRKQGGCAEVGSVGVLRWVDGSGKFDYIDADWLKTFSRHNWLHR